MIPAPTVIAKCKSECGLARSKQSDPPHEILVPRCCCFVQGCKLSLHILRFPSNFLLFVVLPLPFPHQCKSLIPFQLSSYTLGVFRISQDEDRCILSCRPGGTSSSTAQIPASIHIGGEPYGLGKPESKGTMVSCPSDTGSYQPERLPYTKTNEGGYPPKDSSSYGKKTNINIPQLLLHTVGRRSWRRGKPNRPLSTACDHSLVQRRRRRW